MTVDIKKLQEQLMNKIDEADLVQVEKVERYIDLVDSLKRVTETIKREGESVTTKNGAQEFTKAHPLISERNKINASLLSIEKSFGFVVGGDDDEDSGIL
ncbi:P27 family phage terminase small subunit [Bacillus sp. FSL W7-1360]